MWACPHCKQALQLNGARSAWLCSSGHQFDRAKEGYVNLLAANRRGSKAPGDSAQMIAARRRVHQADIYRPLVECIGHLLAGLAEPRALLDLGCGEGYYSAALHRLYPAARIGGIDIARTAVRMAAKQHPDVHFAVASAFQLPLPDTSQDVVLRVFAPSEEGELLRVLVAGGCYLEVTPAPRHMWELRQALYDVPRESLAARESYAGLELQEQSDLDYRVELDRDMLRDVVAMTPFAWRGHREKREALLQLRGLSLRMAFTLRLFSKSDCQVLGSQEVGGRH